MPDRPVNRDARLHAEALVSPQRGFDRFTSARGEPCDNLGRDDLVRVAARLRGGRDGVDIVGCWRMVPVSRLPARRHSGHTAAADEGVPRPPKGARQFLADDGLGLPPYCHRHRERRRLLHVYSERPRSDTHSRRHEPITFWPTW